MAFDYQQTFDRISAKAKIIAERYNILTQEKAKVDRRVEELEKQLDERNKELEKLRLELEYLKIASTITPDREQIEATRAIITSLVRDIDRCIVDLNE